MMSFDEFTEYVKDHVNDYLDEEYEDAQLQTVVKNNDLVFHGISVKKISSNGAPTVYMESYYQKYRDEEADLNLILENIAGFIRLHADDCPITGDDIRSFKPERIGVRLINEETNQQYLKGKPSTPVCPGIRAVYYIDLDKTIGGMNSTVMITDELLKSFEISLEELHKIALENLAGHTTFSNIYSVLKELCPDKMPEEADALDAQLYVISLDNRTFGASAILSRPFLNDIRKQIGSDFLLIFSSVFEVLLIAHPDRSDENYSIQHLRAMVRDINSTIVDISDRLSDNIYEYNWETQSLVVAS